MPWEILIVPIIGVAVWIISTLIRGAEQGKGPEGGPRRRPEQATDLDRFLREVHRRRQARQLEEEPQEQAMSVERQEPQPRAKWSTSPPQETALPAPVPEVIPMVLPVVEENVVAQLAPRAPALRVHEAPPLPELPAEKSARLQPERPESAAGVSLRKLLRSREGIRNAMILHEVLGPPMSRRRAR
jgi:hypothetical protein